MKKKKKTTRDETADLLFRQKHPFWNPRALTSAHFGFSEKKEVWKTEVKIFTPPHLTSAHFDTIFFLQERKTPQLLRDEKFTNLFFVPIAKSLVWAIFRFVPPSFLFKNGKSRVNSLISPKSLNIFRYGIYIYIYIYIYIHIYSAYKDVSWKMKFSTFSWGPFKTSVDLWWRRRKKPLIFRAF